MSSTPLHNGHLLVISGSLLKPVSKACASNNMSYVPAVFAIFWLYKACFPIPTDSNLWSHITQCPIGLLIFLFTRNSRQWLNYNQPCRNRVGISEKSAYVDAKFVNHPIHGNRRQNLMIISRCLRVTYNYTPPPFRQYKSR